MTTDNNQHREMIALSPRSEKREGEGEGEGENNDKTGFTWAKIYPSLRVRGGGTSSGGRCNAPSTRWLSLALFAFISAWLE